MTMDTGQAALGELYVASANITSEIILGQQFNPGNVAGDGRILFPYLTVDQALREIRIEEGQAATQKRWKIWLISKNGEVGIYDRTDRDQNVNYPETDSAFPFYFFFEGYNKEWGPTPTYAWSNINDKPVWGGLNNVTQDQGMRLLKFTNITIRTDETQVIRMNVTAAGDPVKMLFYGCRFQRISSVVLITIGFGGAFVTWFAVGCTFDIGVQAAIGTTLGNNSYLSNCYINNGGTGNCLEFFYTSGGGQTQRSVHWLNCIFVCSGSGFHCVENKGSTDVRNAGFISRTGNTYHVTDGAFFANWSTTGPQEQFTPPYSFGEDDESQALDPIFSVVGEPILGNASPIFDKGLDLGGIWATNLNDPTGEGEDKHLVDARGAPWGDQIGPETVASGNAETTFSQRSPGPTQQLLGLNPNPTSVPFQIGVVGIISPYIVGAVGLDNPAVGTCQAQIIQADDAAGTVNVLKIDSAPINIGAGNKWIDIIEDSGSEVNIALTEGIYNTLGLHTEIQSKLNAAGLTGTYTVTYNTGTQETSVGATGLASGFELMFGTGTNAANSIARAIGFLDVDTVQLTVVIGDNPVDQNFYNAAAVWRYATDYTAPLDPDLSGTWLVMGTGDPGDSGTPGVDGFPCDVANIHIRVDIGNISGIDLKFHGFRAWNGNFRTEAVAVV